MNKYDIAIIGMGGIFPNARNLNEYWENIHSGNTFFEEMPDEYWQMDSFFSPDHSIAEKSYTKLGAFVKDFEFPYLKYKLPPKIMKEVDRAQLIAIEATSEALKTANIKPKSKELEKAVTVLGTSGVDAFAHSTIFLRRHGFFNNLSTMLKKQGLDEKKIDILYKEFEQNLINSSFANLNLRNISFG